MIAINLMDPGINSAAQNFSPALTRLIAEGHLLDSTVVYLLVIAALYLGFHPRHGIRLAVLFGITAGINEALKLVFHLPRPYWVSGAVKAFAAHSSFGFPSGAAMGSVVIYGYIVLLIRRWWVVLLCGILFGSLILVLAVYASPAIESLIAGLSLRARIALIFFVSLVPLIVVMPAYHLLAGWQVLAAWSVTALGQAGQVLSPVQIGYAWTATGILLGCLCGYQVLLLRGGWSPLAGPARRLAVVVAGLLSVLIIDTQLAAIMQSAGLMQSLPELCDLGCAALVCFWFAACIPLIVRRAGLAGTAGPGNDSP